MINIKALFKKRFTQEEKEDYLQGIVLALIFGACLFIADRATKEESQHVQLDIIEKRDALEKHDIKNLMQEYERIEAEIRRAEENRKIQADIQSMYLPPYLAGC